MQKAAEFFGGEDRLSELTSVALLEYNSLCQLFSMKEEKDVLLSCAEIILMMPNLIEYFLTDIIHSEYSVASTTQLFDMRKKVWCTDIIERLGLDPRAFTDVDHTGRSLGKIRSYNSLTSDVEVISTAGHDTACAVASVPLAEKNFTFISCGTWSLMGILSENIISGEDIVRRKIGNEGAADGGYRPTVNINGLWVIQECKRIWDNQGKHYSYTDIAEMASSEAPLRCFIDTAAFMNPGEYPKLIQKYCRSKGQYVPQTDGEIARCVFDSLAMKYRQTYMDLWEHMEDRERIYIVGGGGGNKLLDQLIADALGVLVVIWPSEATAVGNLIVQMESLGELDGRNEAAELIMRSFDSDIYVPHEKERWDEAYDKYLAVVSQKDMHL